MNYRSLLVLLDHESQCERRTQVALAMAVSLDCHVVGLAPTDLIDLPAVPRAAASIEECAALVWDALRDQAERAADLFRDACHQSRARSFEAVIDESEKSRSVICHAHCSDLTILSQPDPASVNHRAARSLVEEVVLYSARPTLVLPYVSCASPVGQSVLVAWDDSREAARAISDALPLLRKAERVLVAVWGTGDRDIRSRLDALYQWLVYHGVVAEMRAEPAADDIGEAILSRAAEWGVDLIVMGAYGRNRWTERVLGGATRCLLDSMTVPVLMSH